MSGRAGRVTFDWQKVTESKDAYRRKLAAQPIAEKLRMLDAMRERALAISSRFSLRWSQVLLSQLPACTSRIASR
jgi:hypothetical protein